MLCEKCKKAEATTHIKKNINGDVTEMHLCADCAAEMGVMDEFRMPEMAVSGLFGDAFFGNFLGAGLAAMNSLSGVERCDYCGSSFNDIVNTGNVGCAHCYEKFYDKLEPSIRKIHGSAKHIGKSISYTEEKDRVNTEGDNSKAEKKEQKSELHTLKEQLKKAVKEQRYEDAATLRDKIKAIQPEG